MDKETFTENVPSDAKGGCELEEKHEQSMHHPHAQSSSPSADSHSVTIERHCGGWSARVGSPRTARAFNKVARLRQAAKSCKPDFEKYFEEMMDCLTEEELDALLRTEEALRYFCWATHQWLQIQYWATRLRFLQPVSEVRAASCGALDLELMSRT